MAKREKKQLVEGLIKNCTRELCKCSCCDDGEVEEWVDEYFAFHERIKDHLSAQGIVIKFEGDRVRFLHCSDGKKCKFLSASLNKDIDARPIDCKIYPYVVDWETIDFDNKVVNVYYWDESCPMVKKNLLDEHFKNEVEDIIKRNFNYLFYGAQFKIRFTGKPQK